MLDSFRKQIFRARKINIAVFAVFMILGIWGCMKVDGQETTERPYTLPTTVISVTRGEFPDPDSLPILMVTVDPNGLPDYLLEVWPKPGSNTKITEYNRTLNLTSQAGVGGRLKADRVYEYFLGENYEITAYSEENKIDPVDDAFLLVDGERLSQELLWASELDSVTIRNQSGTLQYSGVGQMDIFWNIPLLPGEHTALLIIYNREKTQILKYKWNFSIVE